MILKRLVLKQTCHSLVMSKKQELLTHIILRAIGIHGDIFKTALPWSLPIPICGLYSVKVDHPLVEIDPSAGYDRNEDRNVNAQLDVEWSVPKVKGLKLKFLGYYRNDNFFQKQWQVNANQYALGSTVPGGKNAPRLNLESASGVEVPGFNR